MKYLDYYNITKALNEYGFTCKFHISDSDLLIPTTKWITKDYAKWLTEIIKILNFTYTTNTQDCENFAELARVFAQIANTRTEGVTAEAGLAFGVIWIPGHAINIAICSDKKDEAIVKFFEPQPTLADFSIIKMSLREVKLTKEQITGTALILI